MGKNDNTPTESDSAIFDRFVFSNKMDSPIILGPASGAKLKPTAPQLGRMSSCMPTDCLSLLPWCRNCSSMPCLLWDRWDRWDSRLIWLKNAMVCLTWNSLTLQIWQLQTAFGHGISSRQGRLTRALPRRKDVPLRGTGFLSAEHGIVQLLIGLRQCRIQSPFMILLFNEICWTSGGAKHPCFGSQICGDTNLTLIQVCFALEMLLQLLFKAISHFLGDKTNFWGTHGNANNYIMDTYIYIYVCVC